MTASQRKPTAERVGGKDHERNFKKHKTCSEGVNSGEVKFSIRKRSEGSTESKNLRGHQGGSTPRNSKPSGQGGIRTLSYGEFGSVIVTRTSLFGKIKNQQPGSNQNFNMGSNCSFCRFGSLGHHRGPMRMQPPSLANSEHTFCSANCALKR